MRRDGGGGERSIGGGGSAPPSPSGLMMKSLQWGRGWAVEGPRPRPCCSGCRGLGRGAAALHSPHPSQALSRSPPSSGSRRVGAAPFPPPGSASGAAGGRWEGIFSGLVGWRRSHILLPSGFPPACDPSSLQEFRDPFGETAPSSPLEDARI